MPEEKSELEQIVEKRIAQARARRLMGLMGTIEPQPEETPQWLPETYRPEPTYEPEYEIPLTQTMPLPEIPMPSDQAPAEAPAEPTTPWWMTGLKGLEYAALPFSWAGMGARRLFHPEEWGTMRLGEGYWKSPFISKTGGMMPGGEAYEKYRDLPWWEQFAWEVPTLLIGGLPKLGAKAAVEETTKAAIKAATKTGAKETVGIAGAAKGLKDIETMWNKSPIKPATKWTETELKLQEQLNDAYIGLRRMQTTAGKAAPIAQGGERDLITMITRAPGMANAGATRYVLTMADIKRVAPNVSPKDINTFLWAQHGKEILLEKGAGRVLSGGVKTTEELDVILTELAAKAGKGGYKQIEDAAKIVQNIYKEERLRLVNAGFITAEDAALWEKMYPWYNPLRYVNYAEKQAAIGKKVAPFSKTSKGIYRLSETGTEELARPPLEVLGEQLVENEVRIGGNEIAKTIIKLAQEANEPVTKLRGVRPVAQIPAKAGEEALETIFRRTGGAIPGTLSFYENGTRQIYKVPDWIYREAVILSQTVRNPVSSLVGALNGISRAAFTTFSPPFVISNMLNDALTAFITRGIMPHQSGMRLLASLRGLEKDSIMQSFRLAGGYQMRFYGKGAGTLAKEVTASGGKLWKKIIKLIPEAGEAGEQAPRMALFKRQLSKYLPNWKNMTPEAIARTPQARKAAADAVELTINFGRGGYLIKAANPFIIFLNASMEGAKLPFRALRANPAARLRLAGVGVGMMGLNSYNLSYPEYFDIPNSVRWGSAIVMLPSKEKDSRGNPKPNYLCVIPRTREWGLFLAPITYAMEKMFTDNPTDFGTFAKTIAPQLSPIAEVPMPAVLAELTAQQANWDFYWSEPIVPNELQTSPSEEQVTPWTSRTLAEIGGRVGISPVRLQHASSSILGGAGKAVTSVTDYLLDLIVPIKDEQKIADALKEYRQADTANRIRILSKLTPDEQEALFKAMQRPEKGIPIISPVIKRIMPERGGQLYRTSQALAEKELGISAKETEEASNILRSVNQGLERQQKEYDDAFQSGQLTGYQWRQLHSDLGKQYQGALKTLGVIAPSAAQVKEGAWGSYWDIIYTLAGTVPDMRTKGELLYSAYRAIQPQEISLGVMDWETFYRLRDSFIEGLSPEDRALLESQIMARMTPVEQEYYKAQQVLRPYWQVREWAEQVYGVPLTPYQERKLNRLITRVRKQLRLTNPELATYYALFYQR